MIKMSKKENKINDEYYTKLPYITPKRIYPKKSNQNKVSVRAQTPLVKNNKYIELSHL